MPKRHSWAKWLITIALVLIALFAVFHEVIKSDLVESHPPKVSRGLTKRNLYKPADYNLKEVQPVTMKQILDARLHEGDIHTVGQIMVPSDHLRLPIGLGVDKMTLMLAAGTMRPGEHMGTGNYALAGHHMVNSKALFTPLYLHAKPGQMVYLTDMKNVYQYQIKLRKTISMKNIGVVANEKTPEVTLITCNSAHLTDRRLLIGGTLVKKYPLSQASQSLKRFMTRKPNNYKVLSGY